MPIIDRFIKNMNKLGVSLPLTSAILGYNLLILHPLSAQANQVDIPASANKIIDNLQQNNQIKFDKYIAENYLTENYLTDKYIADKYIADKYIAEYQNPSQRTLLPYKKMKVSKPLDQRHKGLETDLAVVNLKPESSDQITSKPTPQFQLYSQLPHPSSDSDEVINVEQLRDVSPGDWAYEALRSLVEKYRCITNSGNGTFEGNRVMNRYEFAHTLNNCLEKVGRKIYSLSNKFSTQEELKVIQRLQSEFATELKTLASKIDSLEKKADFIQEAQFSTTTVLRGRVNFNFISAFGDKKAVPSGQNSREKINDNLTLSATAFLNFDTSFTGKDRLRTNIVAGNSNSFGSGVTGTNMSFLIGGANTNNNARIGSLFYEFPIGKRGIAAIASVADFPTRIFPAFNPVNSFSNFGAESPIYSFAFGTGAIVYYNFTDQLAGGVTYLSSTGSSPNEGLFGGQYTALAQLTYTPSNKLGMALTYGRYYAAEPASTIDVTGSKGSTFAQLPFGGSTATSSNAFGLQLTYKLSNKFTVGGWTSYFNPKAEGSPTVSGVNGSQGSHADIWSWAVTASLTDLGKLGSQLNFVFGMPPKVTSNNINEREDRDTSLHFELSYNYPLTDRIFITPGFLLITNPEHNAANDSIWIGLLRTTFSF
jgi:Carbohydrate-selective porin, OprB family